ncbi:hypothetical protein M8J76_002100 [Diaphorina citri]|nr:hypothetical protein M8J75_001142 [Diaphorina citri]KAI5713606.1 hypothetical protein M8J76_002100 [Diaphorina citri]
MARPGGDNMGTETQYGDGYTIWERGQHWNGDTMGTHIPRAVPVGTLTESSQHFAMCVKLATYHHTAFGLLEGFGVEFRAVSQYWAEFPHFGWSYSVVLGEKCMFID